MKKFTVLVVTTESVQVEADDMMEALQEAYSRHREGYLYLMDNYSDTTVFACDNKGESS